jgi:hypothetical protein
MSVVIRVLLSIVVLPAAYYTTLWFPMALIPLGGHWWIGKLAASACAIGVGRYVWTRSGSRPENLGTYVALGGLVTGSICFSLGFFGPLVFAPNAEQGPLLGLLVTGPLGFLLGCTGGFVYWRTRGRPPQQPTS